MTLRYFIYSNWRDLKNLWFRIRNGFNPRDCWNLDMVLCYWLAQRLDHFARTTHSYPETFYRLDGRLYGNPLSDGVTVGPYDEDAHVLLWRSEVEAAAEALREYAAKAFDLDGDNELLTVEAQQAMHFVANNLGRLWD